LPLQRRSSGRNIERVLGKVRPTINRGNGTDPQQKAGLTEGRLALVHRYMIDAEAAEARAQTEAARTAARTAALAQQQAQRDAAERARLRAELLRIRAEEAPAARQVVAEIANGNGRLSVEEEARARKAHEKDERRTAKQAARAIAAFEKREARERKALAKAAARRRSAESYRS
jgi:hypothetical protein